MHSLCNGQTCAETLGGKSSENCRDQGHYISSLEEFVQKRFKRGSLQNKNLEKNTVEESATKATDAMFTE